MESSESIPMKYKAAIGIMSVLLLPMLLIVDTSILAFYSQQIHLAPNLSLKVQGGNLSFSEEQVLALVNGSRAYGYDLELEKIAFRHHAFRAGGSTGANETANWIKGQFESFGLESWLEAFEFATWDLLNKPTLLIDDDGNQSTTHDQVMLHSFQSTQCSWPTPDEGVFADLVVLPLPEAANLDEIGATPINMTTWNALNITEKVVLIGREVRWNYDWEQTYSSKLSEQPPVAVVYTWWYDWMSFTPPLFYSTGGRPPGSFGPYYWDLGIPVGFVAYEDGLWIKNKESTTNVSGKVSIDSVIGFGTHYNVVGKIGGYENPERCIIISGHYDTPMCGGFCDNGAGTAGVIELARVFSDAVEKEVYRPSYTLLFVAFASEELGLVGSINYVRQHKSEMTNITAVLNLDGIGSDDLFVSETDPVSEFDLDEVILKASQDLGINVTLGILGSDQESFRNPSWAGDLYSRFWGLDANISDATPVESSTMLISFPLTFRDLWSMGTPGWIHTSYDNSTSTETLDWIEVEDLENHIKVAALSITRISSPDIAITNAVTSKTIVCQGYNVSINITIENEGAYTETSNVTAYANTMSIATLTNITMESGSSTVITFTWNTTGFAKGNYTISANATQVPGEADIADNAYTDGTVRVGMLGDIAPVYGLVDIVDVVYVAIHFGAERMPNGTYWHTPPCERCPHDPIADINNDGIIDIVDIVIIATHFGETDP